MLRRIRRLYFESLRLIPKNYLIALTKIVRGKWNYALEALLGKMKLSIYHILRGKGRTNQLHRFLIFSAIFGEQRDIPTTHSCHISMVVDNRLRFYETKIGPHHFKREARCHPVPFAQTDGG